MLRPLTILLVATLATGCKQVAPPPAPTVSAAPDPDQARVRAILAAEEPRVTAYFGSSMPRSISTASTEMLGTSTLSASGAPFRS